MSKNNDLGSKPLIVIIGALASLIAIIVFITGRQSLPEFLGGGSDREPLNNQENTNPIDSQGQQAASSEVNVNYLATLVGQEPFAEQLPSPLISSGFDSVMISDVSAAQRLKAVQIKLVPDPTTGSSFSDLQTFAHIEIYPTQQEAQARSIASQNSLTERYDAGLEKMSPENFCVSGYPDFWTCVGYRGYAYVEVTISPGSNANLSFATGSVSALLRYTDKMTALARN
jgi:hypothetical protein